MAGSQLRSRTTNNKKVKKQSQSSQSKLAPSSTAGDVNAIKAAEAVKSEQNTFSLSLLTAFRVLLIMRCFSALYRILDDCDEVYNYWEPTHYLLQGYGRETWEYSTDYKIRSWAFIFVNAVVGFVTKIATSTKLQTFYLIRLFLAGVSSYVEARFYRTISEEINVHVGHYVFAILFFAAGMFNASTAYLPSTFAMYCVFMAFSYALKPVSDVDRTRTYRVVFWIGLGALGGWPFAALVGVPFAIEEVLVFGRDSMTQEDGKIVRTLPTGKWRLRRVIRLIEATVICGAGLTFILMLMDQMFYRQYTVVAWNIIKYNVFGAEGRGPDLYGTEPWYYYIMNGLLNFNIVFLLAIGSAGCLLVSAYIDRNRLPGTTKLDAIWPYIILGLKLVPFYLWFIVFSLQAHKEERFMYVAYPLLALNAGISVYLIRNWSYRFATTMTNDLHTRIYALRFTSIAILAVYALLSILRLLAILTRYRAPFVVYSAIWNEQAPDQLINLNYLQEDFVDNVDLKLKNVCVGKEWYRFPSQFFLPSDTRLQFLKTNFAGQLPKEFEEDLTVGRYELDDGQEHYYRRRVYGWLGARMAPEGFNDLNQEDPSVYVSLDACDYLVDVDFPLRSASELEPRYVRDEDHWEVLQCYDFIDAENSNRWLRAFWLPGSPGVAWGDYCLLKRK
ncbi:MAG: Alg9-like mannosyltransferase family-domain-containing protein [Benjaminiella poitrasii]|nr:MAG: Alg9-like mannosyltransferase family-domain-containing protein [Benjaminiella poitrasii]